MRLKSACWITTSNFGKSSAIARLVPIVKAPLPSVANSGGARYQVGRRDDNSQTLNTKNWKAVGTSHALAGVHDRDNEEIHDICDVCLFCRLPAVPAKAQSTYIHAYIHTYMHTHTYMHPYIHTYIHTYIYTFMHTDKHTCKQIDHAYMHTYV